MEKMNDLRDLLKHEIEDLQSVEDQIIDALPKMIDKANNPDLKKALSEHLKLTEQHKARLEKVMKNLNPGNDGSSKKGIFSGIFGGGKQVCKGMKGIIDEGEKIMDADISPEALDAAIIASAQKVEHYEICGYGTARTYAKELGMDQIARQLEQTLHEEYEADDILTSLAIMGVNEEAERPFRSTVSASSHGRSAGRVKEKASQEMEMEPVNAGRGRSSAREESPGSRTRSQGRQSISSDSSRTDSRSGSASKKAAGNDGRSKTSGRGNARSSASGRGSSSKGNSSSRGHK